MAMIAPILESISSLTLLQWVLIIVLLGFFIWRKLTAPFKQYSEIPQVTPHWFLGNESFGGELFIDTTLNHYKALGDNRFGIFWEGNRPAIFLKDLDLIKKVQVTDADHFLNLGFGDPEYNEKIGNLMGLASLRGETWKKAKKMVTPPFSYPRLKKTVPALNECAQKLGKYVKSRENDECVDILEVARKFFMNTIASVVFGMDMDCYSDGETDLEKHGKNLLSIPRFLFTKFMPRLALLFKISVLNPEAEKFFMKLCKMIVQSRQESKQEVKDVLGILLNVAEENPDMAAEVLYRTCLQFFTDGYESAAMISSILFHHLLFHPEIQEKIQEEIDAVFENKGDDGEIEQEDLNNMPYLDQVISEGLRRGIVPQTARECTKAWKIPGDNFVIPKGMNVIIPSAGLAWDPKYWTDPLKFDPDRFHADNKGNIDSIVYQPFGSGPRQCLGQNLVRMEYKIMLIELLKNYTMKPYGSYTEDRPWEKDVFIGFKKVDMTFVRRS